MELYSHISCFILVILILTHDALGLILAPSKSADRAVFGNNGFTLTCTYTLETGDTLYYIQLKRQREEEANLQNIIFFSVNQIPSYQDGGDLNLRTNASQLNSGSGNIVVQFNSIKCIDKATYTWEASYANGGAKTLTRSINVPVTAISTFQELISPVFSPSTSLKEGDNVTFTCAGDIGGDPQAAYTWEYYLRDSSIGTDISSQANNEAATYNDTSCSYNQVSSVVLQMRYEFNQIVVRCNVDQGLGSAPKYRLTNNLNVQYGPRTPTVLRQPNAAEYYTGLPSLNLTCQVDANPQPSFYWIVPDGNSTMMVDGAVYRFVNLTEDHTGNYTCVAYNTINLVNYTQSLSVDIVVSMTTTTTTTTPTTPISTENNGSGNPGESTDKKDDDGGTNAALIAGPVVGGIVLIVLIIILVVVFKNKCKKREEIEEPSEKPPSNNQGLSYYGNRPDLVTSDLKNNQNNLNSSFNSCDSSSEIKPRNEDALNYIDLQFDDKPRSRRPIQLIDNGVGYADIDLPRV